MPPRTVRFLATDGPVEVNAYLARLNSELVRDLCEMDESEVLEIPVPFDRETCGVVVLLWLSNVGPITIGSKRETPYADYTLARLLCRALPFAKYLRSDAAVCFIYFRLHGQIEYENELRCEPKARGVPRPRAMNFAAMAGISSQEGRARWVRSDPKEITKLNLIAAEQMVCNMVAYDAEIARVEAWYRASEVGWDKRTDE